MKMQRILAAAITLCLLLSGCGGDSSQVTQSGIGSQEQSTAVSAVSPADMFTDRDYEVGYDETNAITVTLQGDSAVCDHSGVEIDGGTVTVKEEGTYLFSGVLNDGSIVVEVPDTAKPHLVFNGVTVTGKTTAPLYILSGEKVFVTLANNSENTFANGGTFTQKDESNLDGTVFAKQDLTINGAGSLTVTSPAGHGIVCKDDLVITGGVLTVQAASHGLDANDSVRVAGGILSLTAGKDGIHAESSEDADAGFVYISGGTFKIDAQGDGVSAGSTMEIADGSFSITAGGGSENAAKQQSDSFGGFMGGPGGGYYGGEQSAAETEDSGTSTKGLKAAGNLVIHSGSFTIDAADDGVHSNSSVTLVGGNLTVATGDDGIHADDTLTVTGGSVTVTESYEGLEGLHIAISGGTMQLIADDDGLNAAGGTDQSGFGGHRGGDQFGGPGGHGGGQGSSGNGSITISGGTIDIQASGDGIDANGTLEITGGCIYVAGPTMGDTAVLDYDSSATITGGTFIGTGALGMTQSFSDSAQGVIAVNVGNVQAGTEITLADGRDNTLMTYTPKLDFAVVIISSPQMEKGEPYTLTVGTASESFTAD